MSANENPFWHCVRKGEFHICSLRRVSSVGVWAKHIEDADKETKRRRRRKKTTKNRIAK